MKHKFFIDMDGVTSDFYAHHKLGGERRGYGNYPEMYEHEFFFDLPPVKGALETIGIMQDMGLDLWILTQPVKETAHSYSEKARWIQKHLPYLAGKIIMTQDKTHLARTGHVLIDDNLKWKEGWEANGGTFIHFDEDKCSMENWVGVLNFATLPHLLVDADIRKIRSDISRLERGL